MGTYREAQKFTHPPVACQSKLAGYPGDMNPVSRKDAVKIAATAPFAVNPRDRGPAQGCLPSAAAQAPLPKLAASILATSVRLTPVKGKYETDRLLFGHQGAGSEPWSTDGCIRQA
jgi:hypothetical protein